MATLPRELDHQRLSAPLRLHFQEQTSCLGHDPAKPTDTPTHSHFGTAYPKSMRTLFTLRNEGATAGLTLSVPLAKKRRGLAQRAHR
jgi:hypothetical protein